MELFSGEFFAALAAIIVIDLVLAGDNAIVIALAARKLPPHLQKKAVLWGTAGAILVRSAMTLVVVWLLKIPGLLLAGGLLLLWIAYRLLSPDEKDGGHGGVATTTFWGAMKTIVIADAVMGLDNVLAVAGAAHGSYLLVVLGLLISVPIVIWGSTLVLKWVERFPSIVYLGAAVLAWTAAKMVSSEPFLKEPLAAHAFTTPLLYAVAVGGVLWAGFAANHRRLESGITRRIIELARAVPSSVHRNEGGESVERVLIPVDGSANAAHALRHVVRRHVAGPLEVHLLNVQAPFSRHIAQFVPSRTREAYHREQAEKALAPARALLSRHSIQFTEHLRLGDKAPTIAEEAKRLRCDRIVMATARQGSLLRMLQASVTSAVLDRTRIAVEVIAGNRLPAVERYGVPAGIGVAITLLVLAIE
jgi:YjbE family integral membrane protein